MKCFFVCPHETVSLVSCLSKETAFSFVCFLRQNNGVWGRGNRAKYILLCLFFTAFLSAFSLSVLVTVFWFVPFSFFVVRCHIGWRGERIVSYNSVKINLFLAYVFEGKFEKERFKRIISDSGGLGAVQMVSELDTGRCVSGVDCEIPHWLERRTEHFL